MTYWNNTIGATLDQNKGATFPLTFLSSNTIFSRAMLSSPWGHEESSLVIGKMNKPWCDGKMCIPQKSQIADLIWHTDIQVW